MSLTFFFCFQRSFSQPCTINNGKKFGECAWKTSCTSQLSQCFDKTSNRSKCLPSICFKVVVEVVDTEEKQRKLFAHERKGALLKALWEVEFDSDFILQNCLSFNTQICLWHCFINRIKIVFTEVMNIMHSHYAGFIIFNEWFVQFTQITTMNLIHETHNSFRH